MFRSQKTFYASRVQPHTPAQVRVRQSIIYQEILRDDVSGAEKNLSYMDNKELLYVDRKIITLGRRAVSTTRYVTLIPAKAIDVGRTSVSYTKEAFWHLSEATNLRDFAGIGLYEVRGILIGAQDYIQPLRNSTLLDGVISWMVKTIIL